MKDCGINKLIATGVLCLSCLFSTTFAQDNSQSNQENNLKNLPTLSQWLEHASYLDKFWHTQDSSHDFFKIFATWRCDDGSLRNGKTCTGEEPLTDDGWPPKGLTKYDYVRMISRQTFGYGALYNLTGNQEDLRLHKMGVEFLLNEALDPQGGFKLLYENGKAVNEPRETRTTQDLSYALVGLAMNAYLTHDPKVIDTIIKTQKYIYDYYFDESKGMLLWCKQDAFKDKATQEELVAQLDQLNAYLLTTWRLVPQAKRSEWSKVIKKTIDIINTKFYNPKNNRFWGCTDNKTCFDMQEGRHLDNGHTVKSFWMEYLASLGLGDTKLQDFAKRGMIDTLNVALNQDKKAWHYILDIEDASWWIWAELDQVALTLALTNDYPIPNTYYTILNDFTDKKYGELFDLDGMKTHMWHSNFHSTEHALIGAILSNALRYQACTDDKCKMDNLTTLYFAPLDKKDAEFTPYLYGGDIVSIKYDDKKTTVIFKNVGLPKKVN